jgi:dienelactone hydrolase
MRISQNPIILLFAPITAALLAQGTAFAQSAGTPAAIAQAAHPYVRVERKVERSGTPWELHLVQTSDEIYVPIGVRKPNGNGPFPTILIGSGQGRDGMTKIEEAMDEYEELMTRLVGRGYVAAFVSYRNEVPELYNDIEAAELLADTVSGGGRTLRSAPALDSDDHVAIIEHARGLPYTDPDAIGAIGSSHSGEIIMKSATAHAGLAAAVPSEAAVLEYLLIDISRAPRDASGSELQLQDKELARKLADEQRAIERVGEVEIPLLVMGRDDDHLQGAFALLYEWLAETGKDVQWASFDHPEHGYTLLGRSYLEGGRPDAIQEQAFELYMSFFDEHLKGR